MLFGDRERISISDRSGDDNSWEGNNHDNNYDDDKICDENTHYIGNGKYW